MGQFSWIYSDTQKQLVDGKRADTYLLVPPPFQEKYGKAIYEPCYDGYGRFGGYDVYELIPFWNREMIPEMIERIKSGHWAGGSALDISTLEDFFEDEDFEPHDALRDLRWIGIVMACYDEDNAALKCPIKITTKPMEYDNVTPSLRDPNQGWER